MARVRAQWGLDLPWPVRYMWFLWNILQGDLGSSFNYRMPVSELYFERLPNSLQLALAATLISVVVGIPAGGPPMTLREGLRPRRGPASSNGIVVSCASPTDSASSRSPTEKGEGTI